MNVHPTMDDKLETTRPARQTVLPSPGQFESLAVTLWTNKGHGYVRARGWYDVHCGTGQIHRVWIDEREELLEPISANQHALILKGLTFYDIAAQLVDWALDGYACDCDPGYDDE
jgi:hypothetical protein